MKLNPLKKILILILSVIITLNLPLSVNAAKKDPVLNYRKDFDWGVCMHTHIWGAAYAPINMEDQIHLAAELGVKLIRIDASSAEEHLDKFMKLCHGYGIKVMLIVYFPGNETHTSNFDATKITKYFYEIASRYDGKHGCGKADYIQIDNELDHTLMQASHPDGNYKDGQEISHYNPEYLKNYKDQVNAAIKGVRNSGSNAKIIINFVNTRYGLMDYFYQEGVDWDVTGMDWYSKVFHLGDTPFWMGDMIYERYKKPIIICETNINNKTASFDEYDVSNFDPLVEAFKDYYSRDYVKGCCIYELSDELISKDDGSYDQEGHFGLLFTNQNGTIEEPKPHYYRYKKIFGGKNLEKIDWQRFQVAFDNGIDYVVNIKPEGSNSDFVQSEAEKVATSSSSTVVSNKTESTYTSANTTADSEKTTKTLESWDESFLGITGDQEIPVTVLIIAVSVTAFVLIAGAGIITAVMLVKRKKKKLQDTEHSNWSD